jgi:DNA-binding MarR family transcriptional regulator
MLTVLLLRGPSTITELAEFLGVERTTLTRNLALVEREGWVDIRAGEDRRSRIVTATKKGRSVAMAAQAAWRRRPPPRQSEKMEYRRCTPSRATSSLELSKRKEEQPRLLFRSIQFFQTLDASVERYTQTKGLLTSSALAALKLLRNFTRGGLFPSE